MSWYPKRRSAYDPEPVYNFDWYAKSYWMLGICKRVQRRRRGIEGIPGHEQKAAQRNLERVFF